MLARALRLGAYRTLAHIPRRIASRASRWPSCSRAQGGRQCSTALSGLLRSRRPARPRQAAPFAPRPSSRSRCRAASPSTTRPARCRRHARRSPPAYRERRRRGRVENPGWVGVIEWQAAQRCSTIGATSENETVAVSVPAGVVSGRIATPSATRTTTQTTGIAQIVRPLVAQVEEEAREDPDEHDHEEHEPRAFDPVGEREVAGDHREQHRQREVVVVDRSLLRNDAREGVRVAARLLCVDQLPVRRNDVEEDVPGHDRPDHRAHLEERRAGLEELRRTPRRREP